MYFPSGEYDGEVSIDECSVILSTTLSQNP